jgi:hypothetical protein
MGNLGTKFKDKIKESKEYTDVKHIFSHKIFSQALLMSIFA